MSRIAAILSPSSRLRILADLAWVGSFVSVFVLLLLRASPTLPFTSGTALDLITGTQRQVLLWRGRPAGRVETTVQQGAPGWMIRTRLILGRTTAATSQVELRRDLSLARVGFEADLGTLARLGQLSLLLQRRLRQQGRVRLGGRCGAESGICELQGELAGKRVDLPVTAGRGPVLADAIYPLLARGILGRKAELGVFDPLSVQRRVISFHIEQKERLKLRSGTFEAIRVLRDLEGLATRVWLDPRGRVLREELPLGIVLEHESFVPAGAGGQRR